jgi:hypothetical protein
MLIAASIQVTWDNKVGLNPHYTVTVTVVLIVMPFECTGYAASSPPTPAHTFPFHRGNTRRRHAESIRCNRGGEDHKIVQEPLKYDVTPVVYLNVNHPTQPADTRNVHESVTIRDGNIQNALLVSATAKLFGAAGARRV